MEAIELFGIDGIDVEATIEVLLAGCGELRPQ
jgi:hypothetical protein